MAAPFFLFPSMKFIWVYLFIPIIWIWRWLNKKNLLERTIIDWAILFLTIQVFATCIIVHDIEYSLPKISGYVFGITFFYSALPLMKSEKLIKFGLYIYLASGFILSIIGILGMNIISYHKKSFDTLYRLINLIPKIDFNLPGAENGFHPNAIGGTLILIIPLYVLLLFFSSRRKSINSIQLRFQTSIFLCIGFSLTFFSLLLTQSRSSWIGFVFSLCFFLFLSKKGIKWGVIIVLIFLLAYGILLNSNKMDLIKKEMESKIDLRIETWNLAVSKIKEHPFFGIGMNKLRQEPLLYYTRAHAHNHFIHTASELGIPGLIAYLAILIGTGLMCYQTWLKSKIRWMKISALGLGCGQLAHFIFGFADSIPLGAKVSIFFWISLVLITAMYNYTIKLELGEKKFEVINGVVE